MKPKIKIVNEDLGWKQPKGFLEQSKESIRKTIQNEEHKKAKRRRLRPWFVLSGAAASLILFLLFNEARIFNDLQEESIVEDVFVISLLMETLLLEEHELDLRIQESLLDDFEKDLALN